jgi:hypothetical protein
MNRHMIGVSAIALGILSNVPFTILTMQFGYPEILRRPTPEILSAFHAAGPDLVWAWYGYGLSALALIPLSLALAFGRADRDLNMGFLVGSAIVGAFAGLTQAIGLFRWVFVVPSLAEVVVDPSTTDAAKSAALSAFNMMNLFGGVTIGEHIGQILTCLWLIMLVTLQWRSVRRIEKIAAIFGTVTVFGIAIGLGEGLSLALAQDGHVFGHFTTVGFLALTLWLVATGTGYLLSPKRGETAPHASDEAAIA